MCRVYNTSDGRLEWCNISSPWPYPPSRSHVSAAQTNFSSNFKITHNVENEILGWVYFDGLFENNNITKKNNLFSEFY